MSLAFEVTSADVLTVLERHGVTNENADELFDEFILGCGETIEAAALWHDDMDDQTEAALSEIEDILIEEARVRTPKLFGGNLK
jgi:hypothetical protein